MSLRWSRYRTTAQLHRLKYVEQFEKHLKFFDYINLLVVAYMIYEEDLFAVDVPKWNWKELEEVGNSIDETILKESAVCCGHV